MRNRRQEMIHEKGFNMVIPREDVFDERAPIDYGKLKVGLKTIDDAIIDLGAYKKISKSFSKDSIMRALANRDYPTLREISNKFYEISGIYQRFCKYLAQIYRYDWRVIPYAEDSANKAKYLKDFGKVLEYLDNSEVKRMLNNIALEVMKNGAFYGILLDLDDKFTIQQLPTDYCRSRFMTGMTPIIELNMRFFDVYFQNAQYRMKVLSAFPKDIQRGYIMYKEGKLKGDYPGDQNGWFQIDPSIGVKINLCGSDFPPLVEAIPSIIDLDEAQALDRKKVMQQLLKIIIQKLPIDKNGDLIFDLDEAADIHNNAVTMLRRAIGVDVLTTFADIDVADMADKNTSTTTDDLERVERTVFNNTGLSQNLFNTQGNVALEKSVLNDEASVKDLIYQFQSLLTRAIDKFNRANHYKFRAEVLETTIYNYKEISKLYKEQTQIGFSKILPQIALGHSQSSVIATATFENEVLKLNDIMIPPMMSSVMSPGKMQQANAGGQTQSAQNQGNSGQGAGRPAKAADQKSEKTIANREAMGKEG